MRRRWPHGRSGAKYNLPKAVYWQVYWTIKDYNRLKDERNSLTAGPSAKPIDGMPHDTGANPDGVLNQAVRFSELDDKLKAIERARDEIPVEYRKAVWQAMLYDEPFPVYGTAYGMRRKEMIYKAAIYLKLYRPEN